MMHSLSRFTYQLYVTEYRNVVFTSPIREDSEGATGIQSLTTPLVVTPLQSRNIDPVKLEVRNE